MKSARALAIAVSSSLLLSPIREAAAYEGVDSATIERFEKDGTLETRRARAEMLQSFRMPEGFSKRAVYKVDRAVLEASGLSTEQTLSALTSGPRMSYPFSSPAELRAIGNVKTLTVLVDFSDFRAAKVSHGVTRDNVQETVYGKGNSTFGPLESAHAYYHRASQGKFDLTGNVLGWHSFDKKRNAYEPALASTALPVAQREQVQKYNDNRALFALISEALDAYDASHDYSQYDNDKDGDIDLVTVLYSGPHTDWGSFWWAYRWELFVPEAEKKLFDGKRVKQFVFQFVETRGTSKEFDPTTIIHEIGHSLGLADYYDYDAERGIPGGVGGLDMMDANSGNHNAFSRWLLDWIKPTVLREGLPAKIQLTASGSLEKGPKAIAIFPALDDSDAPSREMFIVEHRFPVGNDLTLPGKGLLVWHIDASVNASNTDFQRDNSKTAPKLIRLVRADNEDDFMDQEPAGPGTFFAEGGAFTPTSKPSSADNRGNDTRVVVDQVGKLREVVDIRVGFLDDSSESPTIAQAPPPAPQPAPIPGGLRSLDDLEALDLQYSGSTSAELSAQWADLQAGKISIADPTMHSAVATLLLSRWASKDGHAATAAALAVSDTKLQEKALPHVLTSWTENNPAQAAKWYLAQGDASFRKLVGVPAGPEFIREAFKGLYVSEQNVALEGVGELTDTAETMAAVDGILVASGDIGESREDIYQRLIKSGSEAARARAQVRKAVWMAEDSIENAQIRAEFRDLMNEEGWK